jgi:hypothetical protein
VTSTAPFPLRTRTRQEPEPDLTPIVVAYRAMRQDPARLAARLDRPAGPAAALALRRYTAALLTQIHARHRSEEGFLWPLLAATAGSAVDLAPLADDWQAIDAAAALARQALAGPLAALRRPVYSLAGLLDAHLTDAEQQVFPALRRYLPADAYRWAERQIWQNASAADRRFAAPWLAGYARAGELPRLPAGGGWPARIRLAAARPGYARLERRAFGPGRTETQHHEEEK